MRRHQNDPVDRATADASPAPTVALVRMEHGRHELPPIDAYAVALTIEATSFVRKTAIHRRPYRVGRSFCCLRRPGASVSIEVDGPSTDVLVVAIPRPWLEHHLDGTGASLAAGEALVECVDPTVTLLAEKLLAHPDTGRDPLGVDGLNHAVILHLLARHGRGEGRVAALSTAQTQTLLDYIEHNLSAALSLDHLAAVAGTSRFNLARSFARETGISPHRYVMARRTRAAVSLIRAGELSLPHIALATGFCDQAHMSRWVSREIDISPMRLARASLPDPL